jgi:ribonuclease HII
MPDFSIEKEKNSEGYRIVCGIDEAGRGPLCGPVVAAACILPIDVEIPRLNDSKKLTPKARQQIFDLITEKAIAYSVAYGTVDEIDKINILEATLLAMRRAVESLEIKPDYLLVDGNIFRGFDIPGQSVIKGDALSSSIAAASILAKVTRDTLCEELDSQYPEYGFKNNKGYGTKDHIEALRKYGPTPCHRKKFIRFLDKN